MNEREALMRAVCENPDDDTPRLVFADWLQENGEHARAEFIRLQIQLARGTYRPSEEARLKRRELKLRAHTAQWKAGEVPEAESVGFVRGFVEVAMFANEAAFERSIGVVPFRRVTIRGPVDLLAVMRLPGIGGIESLGLEVADVCEVDVAALAETDWPEHPRHLLLSYSRVPAELRERVTQRHGGWVWFPSWS